MRLVAEAWGSRARGARQSTVAKRPEREERPRMSGPERQPAHKAAVLAGSCWADGHGPATGVRLAFPSPAMARQRLASARQRARRPTGALIRRQRPAPVQAAPVHRDGPWPRSFLKAENKHAAVHSAARPRPPQGQQIKAATRRRGQARATGLRSDHGHGDARDRPEQHRSTCGSSCTASWHNMSCRAARPSSSRSRSSCLP